MGDDETSTTMSVGTDLMEVSEVESSLRRFGDRYLDRVFTPSEASACRTPGGLSAAELAARVAAKESVIKALRPTGAVGYHDIEVRLDTVGSPTIHLSGAMGDHAAALGLTGSSLCLGHDGGLATAVFLAVLRQPSLPSPPETRK